MADKTFTAMASIITPATEDDSDFMDLMRHTCDIELASRGAASSGSYGHKAINFDTPSQVFTGIRCRLRELTADEIQATGRFGEVIEDKVMYVPHRWMPDSMKQHVAPVVHQVTNIRLWMNNELVNAGPFDVQSVKVVAGEVHHYEVVLRKAG